MAHYLRMRSADAVASLRKAGHDVEFVERMLRDMHAARAVMKERGLDPHKVREFLATLRETLQHVQDNFELQMLDKNDG
jgi:hypothetical protein